MDVEQRHLELLGYLRRYLTRNPGNELEVSHSLDTPVLDDPPLIEGEQPDLLARSLGGKLIIGLARTGPDFLDERSQAQFKAFGGYVDPETGEGAALNVAVPGNFKEQAQAGLEAAGLSSEQFNLLGVNGFNS